MKSFLDSSNKPADWPVNNRECMLENIYLALERFKEKPSYKTKEVLLSLINEHDLNQRSYEGLHRVTNFEVELINILYLSASVYQINALKVYLYGLIADTTRMQKMSSWIAPIIGEENDLTIQPYEDILWPPLKMYYYIYRAFNYLKEKTFTEQTIEIVNYLLEGVVDNKSLFDIYNMYSTMLTDISYMHGTKREGIWKFTREELSILFELEAKIVNKAKLSPVDRPIRGVLNMQISNFILKSRNNYNEDYICKYVTPDVAKLGCSNHQIWMKKTKFLNDEREQKIIPELFEDKSWIQCDWVQNLDFTPTRDYYVSSFSKSINNKMMKDEYGSCVYGFKDDRIVEVLGPIGVSEWKRVESADFRLPEIETRPYVSQVLTFDVLYDKEQAKDELSFLFTIIDKFDMSNEDKKKFLERILQYWILSVKDSKWSEERERRYVLFLYDDYEYKEVEKDEMFLKVKTSLFLLPDFILGNNPVRYEIQQQLVAKRKSISTKRYMLCKDCMMQDFDLAIDKAEVCPICGSSNLQMIEGMSSEQ